MQECVGACWRECSEQCAGFYNASSGYPPGLAEVIGCFAEPEMPQTIEHGTDTLISMFSARSLRCFLNDFLVLQLLIRRGNKNSTPPSKIFTAWATDYPSSLNIGFLLDQLQAALKFARTYFGIEVRQREPISWTKSRRCLDVIKLLDKKLSILCHLLAAWSIWALCTVSSPNYRSASDPMLLHDTSAQAQSSNGYWRDFIGPVVTDRYMELCSI